MSPIGDKFHSPYPIYVTLWTMWHNDEMILLCRACVAKSTTMSQGQTNAKFKFKVLLGILNLWFQQELSSLIPTSDSPLYLAQ